MTYLAFQKQGDDDNFRSHPVDVLDDLKDRRRLGAGTFAFYEFSDDWPPEFGEAVVFNQSSSVRSTEVK